MRCLPEVLCDCEEAGYAFFFVARKVFEAHHDTPVQTGREELIGALAEARSELDPEGQVWIEGALWGAPMPSASRAASTSVRSRATIRSICSLPGRPAAARRPPV